MLPPDVEQQASVTFSPGLSVEDPSAAYWLRQVTARLRREICWCWKERGISPNADKGSLPPVSDKASESLKMESYKDEKKKFFETDETARYLTERIGDSPPSLEQPPVRGSFGWVVDQLQLDDTAAFVLALGLAQAFDNAVGSVMASCLNDSLTTYPTLALAQKLWDEPEQILRLADPSHPLFCRGLLRRSSDGSSQGSATAWGTPVCVPSLVVKQMLFPSSPLPTTLNPVYTRCQNASDGLASTHLRQSSLLESRLASAAADWLRVVPVHGPPGCGHIGAIREFARRRNRDTVQLTISPSYAAEEDYMDSVATVCWLRDVDLVLGAEMTSLRDAGQQRSRASLLPLHSIPITLFTCTSDRNEIAGIPSHLLLPGIEVPSLSYRERIAHWKTALGESPKELENTLEKYSRRFRYEKETINTIADGLKKLTGGISEADLELACRAELNLDLGDLAQRVSPRFEKGELILPHKQQRQFDEVVKAMKSLAEVHYEWGTAQAWNESGISVLFAGPPGTGKTMAAEILAEELDLPMYRIDLSQVVNKYIGETEKNLKRLFDAADVADMILFFDEADALFGRRTEVKDAHDRYANLEISYLLERMERFKGMAILATNRKKDIDGAFLRRLRYIIDFPFPDVDERRKIWLRVIPEFVDKKPLDVHFLAKAFRLTGGQIRSTVLNACLQSAGRPVPKDLPENCKGQLTMEDTVIAVKREYDKSKRVVSPEHFGPYKKVIENLETNNDKA